jgi:hypothetical protein
MDMFSSAPLFDGWEQSRETDFLRWRALDLTGLWPREGPAAPSPEGWPVLPPMTWLAREGWRRAGGLIGLGERPERRDGGP